MLAGFALPGLIGCLVGAPGVVLGKTTEISERLYEGGLDRLPPGTPSPFECLGAPPSRFASEPEPLGSSLGQLDTATDEVAVRDRLLGSNSQEGDSWRRTRSSSWDWYLNREPDLKGGGMGIAPTANPLLRQESQDLFGPASFPPVLPKLNFLCPPQLIF